MRGERAKAIFLLRDIYSHPKTILLNNIPLTPNLQKRSHANSLQLEKNGSPMVPPGGTRSPPNW